MKLTKSQYDSLKPFIATIKHVSFGGNTSNSDPWWAMNTVEMERSGNQLTAGCSACMVNDYQRYWNLIQEYETNIFNLENNN